MDAQIKFTKEECVLDMEQYGQRNDAALKDAQVLLKREECALGMEQKSNEKTRNRLGKELGGGCISKGIRLYVQLRGAQT